MWKKQTNPKPNGFTTKDTCLLDPRTLSKLLCYFSCRHQQFVRLLTLCFHENSTPYLTHKAGIFEVLWWTKRCEPCDSSTSVPLHVYQARSPTCLMDFVSIVSPRDSPWPDFALHSLNLSWWCSVSPDSLLCVSFPQVLLELHSGDPLEGTSRHPADWGLICQHPQVHRNYFKRCKSPSNVCVCGISGSIVQLLNARTMSGLNGIEMHIPVLKSLRCNVFATHACSLLSGEFYSLSGLRRTFVICIIQENSCKTCKDCSQEEPQEMAIGQVRLHGFLCRGCLWPPWSDRHLDIKGPWL